MKWYRLVVWQEASRLPWCLSDSLHRKVSSPGYYILKGKLQVQTRSVLSAFLIKTDIMVKGVFGSLIV